MRTLPLGKDGPNVPVVCFGTFPIGGGFGAIPESQAISTIHSALDAGLTFIDTAEGYSNAEELLGKGLKGRRQEVFLATKLSRSDHSPDQIDEALENSLRKLGTDYVDLYQIHGPQPAYTQSRRPSTGSSATATQAGSVTSAYRTSQRTRRLRPPGTPGYTARSPATTCSLGTWRRTCCLPARGTASAS